MLEIIDGVEHEIRIVEITEPNGKISKIINRYPVLEKEEKEKIHQEALQVLDRMLKKYNLN